MNNREKIIRAIEKAKKQSEEYAHDTIVVPFKEADIILALLKEQEPTKPIYSEEKFGDHLPHCPVCKGILPSISQYGESNFCHRCGQAVKWQ